MDVSKPKQSMEEKLMEAMDLIAQAQNACDEVAIEAQHANDDRGRDMRRLAVKAAFMASRTRTAISTDLCAVGFDEVLARARALKAMN
jgi:transcription elongation GreA/GreB family factor